MGRKRTPEREEFLADILTTAVEGGINDWAEVIRYKWDGREHKDYLAVIVDKEWAYDGDDSSEPDFPEQTITIDVIAKGIGVIKGFDYQPNYFGDGGSYWRQFLLADRTNGDDGDYDAIVADWIVQAGLFGEIVYG